jgi:ribosomal protein L11 methylase PrmA
VAETVAANLMRPLLLQLRRSIREEARTLVLSGLLEHEADEVAEAYAPWVERRRLVDRGWAAVLLSA